jgi:hypothetical protein
MTAESKSATRRQRPTLMIGLGGTGKQVLLNFRRLCYERFGEVTLPHVAHLWIDTDTRNVTLEGKPMDFLMREVDFVASEKLSTELRKDDLRNYYDHREAHPEVFSWFDERLTKLQEIKDGAGGIRSFGRLSFFCHYEKIMAKLREKKAELERAVSHNVGREEFGIEIESGEVEFWLIFSIAGGTGAGMFLDMAFALKSEISAGTVKAVIVLPSVFTNDFQQRPFGNGYASLMELEHYSAVKDQEDGRYGQGLHAFHAAWTRDAFERESNYVRGPVFDSTYLIGNQPYDGRGKLTLEDKNALCQMIAEALYVEYSPSSEATELASAVRSARSNFNTALNRSYIYPNAHEGLRFTESFSCRYSSFGLSKIHIPIHRIEAAIYYRLARDFVEFWTREELVVATLDEQLERTWLHQIEANNGARHRDFYRAVESAGEGKTLSQQLRQMLWGERRGRILNTHESPAMRAAIMRWIDDLLTEQLERSHALRSRWGGLAQSIAQNEDQHAERVLERVTGLVVDLLSQPGQRFDTAREVLRRIRDRLLKDKAHFDRAAEASRNAGSRAMREAQRRLEWLDDLKPGYSRRVVAEVALDSVEDRMKKELQAQVLLSCGALADRVANAIGVGQKSTDAEGNEVVLDTGLLKQLADYRRSLRSTVLPALNDRYGALRRSERSPIYQDLSEGEAEVDRYYIDPVGRPVVDETLMEWERQLFEEADAGQPNNLWDLRITLDTNGVQAVVDRLVEFARGRMAHLRDARVDVLERLVEKYPLDSDRYRSAISNLLGYGQPFLAKPTHFADKQDESPQLARGSWLAVGTGVNPTHRNNFAAVLAGMATGSVQVVSGAADRVYAYSEVAGLPLMVVPDLDRYRNNAYFPLLERGEVLHTDLQFEKFRDLLVMDKKEVVAHIDALRTLLKAILLGVVRAKQDVLEDAGDVITYLYRMTSGGLFEKEIDLGPFSLATRRLARTGERALRDAIAADVMSKVNAMDDERALHWYALLSFHGNDDRSFFKRFSKDHIVRVLLEDEARAWREERQVENESARMYLDNLRHWALERPLRSGLYIYREQ